MILLLAHLMLVSGTRLIVLPAGETTGPMHACMVGSVPPELVVPSLLCYDDLVAGVQAAEDDDEVVLLGEEYELTYSSLPADAEAFFLLEHDIYWTSHVGSTIKFVDDISNEAFFVLERYAVLISSSGVTIDSIEFQTNTLLGTIALSDTSRLCEDYNSDPRFPLSDLDDDDEDDEDDDDDDDFRGSTAQSFFDDDDSSSTTSETPPEPSQEPPQPEDDDGGFRGSTAASFFDDDDDLAPTLVPTPAAPPVLSESSDSIFRGSTAASFFDDSDPPVETPEPSTQEPVSNSLFPEDEEPPPVKSHIQAILAAKHQNKWVTKAKPVPTEPLPVVHLWDDPTLKTIPNTKEHTHAGSKPKPVEYTIDNVFDKPEVSQKPGQQLPVTVTRQGTRPQRTQRPQRIQNIQKLIKAKKPVKTVKGKGAYTPLNAFSKRNAVPGVTVSDITISGCRFTGQVQDGYIVFLGSGTFEDILVTGNCFDLHFGNAQVVFRMTGNSKDLVHLDFADNNWIRHGPGFFLDESEPEFDPETLNLVLKTPFIVGDCEPTVFSPSRKRAVAEPLLARRLRKRSPDEEWTGNAGCGFRSYVDTVTKKCTDCLGSDEFISKDRLFCLHCDESQASQLDYPVDQSSHVSVKRWISDFESESCFAVLQDSARGRLILYNAPENKYEKLESHVHDKVNPHQQKAVPRQVRQVRLSTKKRNGGKVTADNVNAFFSKPKKSKRTNPLAVNSIPLLERTNYLEEAAYDPFLSQKHSPTEDPQYHNSSYSNTWLWVIGVIILIGLIALCAFACLAPSDFWNHGYPGVPPPYYSSYAVPGYNNRPAYNNYNDGGTQTLNYRGPETGEQNY